MRAARQPAPLDCLVRRPAHHVKVVAYGRSSVYLGLRAGVPSFPFVLERSMGSRDPRIDQYIARAPDFARPILTHLREVVHAACPEVEETMKWNFPHFQYRGMLCGMAAFKAHCTFGFWKGALVLGKSEATDEKAMGQFG